jgi:Ca2+-binding RTX toxin-like protein
VFGEAGNNSLSGGFQSTLSGGDGADTLSGGGLVFGDDGNDSLNGASFGVVETLDGGAGDDHVFGGFFFGKALELGGLGNDTLGSGYVSQDTMDGGVGDDRLVSNAGSSVMLGGDGADDLFFAGGSNTMTGGAGADLFEAGAGVATLAGMDRITDWSREDSLHFNDLPAGGVAFFSTTAQDFAGALSAASQTIAQQNGVVAVQVGTDVIVFAGNASGQVDVAVDLVGRALTDILPSNIV